MDDSHWMQMALVLAQEAADRGEVPIGALLVKDNEVIGRGYNHSIGTCDPTAHAEIMALREGAKHLQNYRLPGTTLYVTLEPCAMCVGACHHARIERLVFGASDPKTGCVLTHTPLMNQTCFHHTINITSNVLAEPASAILKAFFKARR